MSAPVKFSHQREAIYQFLQTRKDHPTADVVYQNIRLTIPNISLGTVYRNLNQMALQGRILRLVCDGKTDHFDACITPHCHFNCTKCGAVIDIENTKINELLDETKTSFDGEIKDVSIMFSGLCSNCK